MQIPEAKDMAQKTDELIETKLDPLLKKVSDGLDKATSYNATILVSQKDENIVDAVIKRLRKLGYTVDYTPGHYDDRPCGGYTNGRLLLDWSREKGLNNGS